MELKSGKSGSIEEERTEREESRGREGSRG